MKNSKLLLCLPAMTLALAGCSNGGSSDAGLNFSPEPVKTNELISATHEVEENNEVIKPEMKLVNDTSKDVGRVVNAAYANSGLLEVSNSYGYNGFYSLIHDDYIVSPRLVPNTYDYEVHALDGTYFLELHYENKYFVYDGFGNSIGTYDYEIYNLESSTVNGVFYVGYSYEVESEYYFNNDVYDRYLKYAKDGSFTDVEYIPTEIPVEEDDYEGPALNDLFKKGSIDLKDYGLEGYVLSHNGKGYFTIYNNNSFIGSFYVENMDVNMIAVVGDSLYYQVKDQLPSRAEEYDYSVNDDKYDLSTFKVNVTNGEKTELDLGVVFVSITPLINKKDGKVEYSLAKYRKINSDKTLSQTTTNIVDKNFVFHDDISGITYLNIRRISENRYLDDEGVLYDEAWNPIAYLTELNNRVVYKNQKVIQGRVDGKYGLVDFDGKVVVEFRYDHIYTSLGKNGTYLAKKGDEIYRIHARSNNEELLGTNAYEYKDGDGESYNLFYAIEEDGDRLYFTTSSDLFTAYEGEFPTVNHFATLGEYEVFVFKYSDTYFYDFHVVATEGFAPHAISEEVKGSENFTTKDWGNVKEEAYSIATGLDNIHTFNGYPHYVWLKLSYSDVARGLFLHAGESVSALYGYYYSYSYYPYDHYESLSTPAMNDCSYKTATVADEFSKFYVLDFSKYYTEFDALIVKVQTDSQYINVLVDRVEGLLYSYVVDLGTPGVVTSHNLTMPLYINNIDKYWVRFKSYHADYYSFSISGYTIDHIEDIYGDNDNYKYYEYNMTYARAICFQDYYETVTTPTGSATLSISEQSATYQGRAFASAYILASETAQVHEIHSTGFAKITRNYSSNYENTTFDYSVEALPTESMDFTNARVIIFNEYGEFQSSSAVKTSTSGTITMEILQGYTAYLYVLCGAANLTVTATHHYF